jgi:hypothetical protein
MSQGLFAAIDKVLEQWEDEEAMAASSASSGKACIAIVVGAVYFDVCVCVCVCDVCAAVHCELSGTSLFIN